MKVCTKCKFGKEDDEFNWRYKAKGIRASWCKLCHRQLDNHTWATSEHRRVSNAAANKERRKRNARFLWGYLLKHPCSCGETDPVVLDSDHYDPKTKRGSISDMSRTAYSIAVLETELAKCNTLCANCHRRRTAKQFGWYKFLSE